MTDHRAAARSTSIRRLFDVLEAGDILFIDSSHVSKVGSDVNLLFFDVLPRLRPGVWVHVHDIGYPFEYSREWIFEGRAWNEAYLLHAMLIENPHWDIELWCNYLSEKHADCVDATAPAERTSRRAESLAASNVSPPLVAMIVGSLRRRRCVPCSTTFPEYVHLAVIDSVAASRFRAAIVSDPALVDRAPARPADRGLGRGRESHRTRARTRRASAP